MYGAPGITKEQQKALIDAVVKATKQKAWADSLAKNDWTPTLLTGDDFKKFVDDEHAKLRAIMVKVGLI